MQSIKRDKSGFSMIEMVFGVMILGVVLLVFMGIFTLFQSSSAQTRQSAATQQNARVAIDFITEHLRQAGSGTAYSEGQLFIVHAAPYQVAMNADIDNGETIAGDPPLTAIDTKFNPSTVPVAGTTIYAPTQTFTAGAETVVLTIDSDSDGVIAAGDQGDDLEESGPNTNAYLLKRVTYGSDGTANVVRPASLALLRGPGAYPDASNPPPLFQYFYDHDDDPTTANLLWGDTGPVDGKLTGAEITALTPVPAIRLGQIRMVRVAVVSEAEQYNQKYEATGGYLSVTMNSEVYIRNAYKAGSAIYGKVFYDEDGDGVLDPGENGLAGVRVRLVGRSRDTQTNSSGDYYFAVTSGKYGVQEYDPPNFTSTSPNNVQVTPAPAEAVEVNFGDTAGPSGYLLGTVFDDLDMDGVMIMGEPGISGVQITLDTGQQLTTDAVGEYRFLVPVGTYNVVETDPDGYGSTTPNYAQVTILDGDSVIVDFGDNANALLGRILGYVYYDVDHNGVFDTGESGLPNVRLNVKTFGTLLDTTITNAYGYYQFSLQPGTYEIEEKDPRTPVTFTSSTVSRRRTGVPYGT